MVLKIQVEFSTPISIQGENAKNSMFVILEPYLDDETTTTIPNFASDTNALNNGFKASTTHLGKTFANVFETNPTNMEVNGKYLKLTLDSYFDDIYKFLKNFHFFYKEQEENGKIFRNDVPSSFSQSTKFAVSNSTGLVEQNTSGGDLEPKDQFEFKIEKILIKDEEPDKIFYFYTRNRTLTIKDGNGLVDGTNVVVANFLDQTFTNANEYYDTAGIGSTQQQFSFGNGITTGEDANGDKFFYVERANGSGRLTQNSTISNASFDSSNTTYTTTDEFGLTLEIPNNITTVLDNKIKNPTLHGEIIPSIGGQGYIAIKMSKDNGNTFLNMVAATDNNNDTDRTIRHGGTADNATTTHPLANNGLTVSAGNAYNGLSTLDFNFKSDGNKEISTIVGGQELKVEIDQNGDDVILMRLNRFPRSDLTYSIDYTHQPNLASGFFGPNNNAVLKAEANSENAIVVSNDLQEVTATVGKFKVYYPPQKPQLWSDGGGNFNNLTEYKDFSAYYYVDIAFKRGTTPVTITAKYDAHGAVPYTYQTQSGHNIHHGLILTKDNTLATPENPHNGKVDEEITRTTIRDNNNDVVFLNNNSFGTKLRIELPVAIGNDSNKYPYDTSVEQGNKLTNKNFANLDSNSQLDLIDREKLENGTPTNPKSYYYINVMDSLGNVVSPIKNQALQTDNDWGKASDGSFPEIEKAEYQAEYDTVSQSWAKKVVLTFNHDLKEDTAVNITNLFNSSSVGINNNGDTIDKADTPVITQSTNAVSIKVQDPGEGSNNGTLTYNSVVNGDVSVTYTQGQQETDTIFNWLGFKIASFDETLVLASNMSSLFPTISNINFAYGTDDGNKFSGILSWNLSSSSKDGLTYKVEYSTTSDFSSETTVTEEATQAHNGDASQSQTKTIGGLNYNQDYYFRVTGTNFEDGTPATTTTPFSREDIPVFTSSNTFYVRENTTNVGTVAVDDSDSTAITLTLGGTNGDDFNLDSSSGDITFKQPAVLASQPLGGYSITITASDGNNSTSQNITVNIIDYRNIEDILEEELADINDGTSNGIIDITKKFYITHDFTKSYVYFDDKRKNLSLALVLKGIYDTVYDSYLASNPGLFFQAAFAATSVVQNANSANLKSTYEGYIDHINNNGAGTYYGSVNAMITDNSYNNLFLVPQSIPYDTTNNYISAMSGILRAEFAPDNDTEKRTAFIRLNGITGASDDPTNAEIKQFIENNFSNIRSPYTDGATNYELCYDDDSTPGSEKFTLRYYGKDNEGDKISGTEFNILNAIIENDIIKFCRFVDYNQTVGASNDDKFPESSTALDKYSYQYPLYGANTLYNLDSNMNLYQALSPTYFSATKMAGIVALRYNGGASSQGTKIINPLPNLPGVTGFSVSNSAGPTVVASWDKPADATQYKLEYRKMGYDQNGNTDTYGAWQDITGFSEFTESTDSNGTTVSYTFDENNGQLEGNTKYQFKVSYSTSGTTTQGPYTFGPVSAIEEIITYPDESYTFTIENSSNLDSNLAYNSLKVSWEQETTDSNKHQLGELDGFGEVIYEIHYDSDSTFANSPNTQLNSDSGVITMGASATSFPPVLDNNILSASTTYYIRVRSYNIFQDIALPQYSSWIPDSNSTQISKSTNVPHPAPIVTEPEGEVDFKVEFKDDIASATDYKVFVSTDSSFPEGNNTYTSELSQEVGSPATDFGNFSSVTNTFYYVKYEAGISDEGTPEVITYYSNSGNDTTYLSLAATPSFTLAPVHGGSQLEFTGTFPDTNTSNQGHDTQGDTGITFDYGFELKAYDTTLNGDNQTGYDSSWTTIPGPQPTSTGGGSIWIYDGDGVVDDYGSDPLVQNLQANTAYKFRARVETTPIGTGITGGGYSPYSQDVEMMTLPEYTLYPDLNTSSTSHSTSAIPLTIVKITAVLPDVNINGAIPGYAYKLDWNTATDFNGTGGTVTFTNMDGVVNNQNVYVLGDPSHANESLASNTLYYIGISVTNQNNQGENTKPFTNRILNSNGIFTVPEAVTLSSASYVANTSITLTWNNVARSDNGSTFYKLEVSTDGGNNYTDENNYIFPDSGSSTTYVYSQVSNGINYTFRITAKNSNNNVTTASVPVTTQTFYSS